MSVDSSRADPKPDGRTTGTGQRWPVTVIGALALLNGLLSVSQALFVRIRENPHFLTLPLPYGIYHWSRLLALLFGSVLLYLSFHLFQRRRAAWWLSVIGLALAILVHTGHGHAHHVLLWAMSTATLVLLIVYRRRFTVRSEPRSIVRGLVFMAGSLLFALLYGTFGFYLLDKRDFGIDFLLDESLVRTLRQYLLIGNSDLVAHTKHALWFLDSLGVIGTAAFVFAVYSLFRPLAFRLRTLPHERARAAELLDRYGRTPEHYFALWPDKSFFVSRTSDGFISYRVAGGVAVTLSDPVAPEAAVPDLLRQFLDYCADNGWPVALLYTQPDWLPVYEAAGLRALKIGSEAIINLERFCTETNQSKQFRRNKRRLIEDGFSVGRYSPPHAAELVRELETVSREWLSLPGRRERSFALGSFSPDYAARTSFFAVRDRAGRIVAFANETPAYRPGMATIDMMRHRADVPHGIMDFLFDSMLCTLHEQGFRQFDLGLAPLAGVGEQPGSTTEERVVRQLFDLLGRFFPMAGLRAYKAKFDPEWEDRFLVYQGGPAGLVRTAIALSRILS
jgi:phosphatidylglycerol lysyltransferase